jgi:hypothetical protein
MFSSSLLTSMHGQYRWARCNAAVRTYQKLLYITVSNAINGRTQLPTRSTSGLSVHGCVQCGAFQWRAEAGLRDGDVRSPMQHLKILAAMPEPGRTAFHISFTPFLALLHMQRRFELLASLNGHSKGYTNALRAADAVLTAFKACIEHLGTYLRLQSCSSMACLRVNACLVLLLSTTAACVSAAARNDGELKT